MARPSDGTTTVERSRTAIAAVVAARHHLYRDKDREEFCEAYRLRVGGGRSLRSAVDLRERTRPTPNLAGGGEPPNERDWLWPSFEVDTFRLGLDRTIAWLPGPAFGDPPRDQVELLRELRKVPGVERIYDCYADHVVVIGATYGPVRKAELEFRLRVLCPTLIWAEARSHDRDAPARAWLRAARDVGADEGRAD